MKIAFDFDDVLDREDIQVIAKNLMRNHEIFVISARPDVKQVYIINQGMQNWNDDLFLVIDTLNIKRENVFLVNNQSKRHKIIEHDIDILIDDSMEHIDECQDVCKTIWLNPFHPSEAISELLKLTPLSD